MLESKSVFKERHVVTNFWTERGPLGIAVSLVLSITAAESQTFTPRLSAPVVLTSIQSNREADKLNIRPHKCERFLSTSRALNLCTHRICAFRSAAPSLTRKHAGIQAFYSASVGWCGRHYAALPHQAQTGSQINILSPAGQPVQAGLSASESSPWGSV